MAVTLDSFPWPIVLLFTENTLCHLDLDSIVCMVIVMGGMVMALLGVPYPGLSLYDTNDARVHHI